MNLVFKKIGMFSLGFLEKIVPTTISNPLRLSLFDLMINLRDVRDLKSSVLLIFCLRDLQPLGFLTSQERYKKILRERERERERDGV